MGFPAKLMRMQLNFFRPLVSVCSLETTRRGQNKLGELMASIYKDDVIFKDHPFACFEGAWVIPKDERRKGVILYLHGGGYTCGDLEYAKGFGATLSAVGGVRVFCAAYRLAPEHRFPAALEDALEAYRYLLSKGYAPRQIAFCGESAGGGLAYALCLKLKELNMSMPCGVIGISPWTDLTGSGASYETNKEIDVSMSAELLAFYADCYTEDKADPLASPLFGDLKGLPPSLLFAGGDEILLDDSRMLHDRLLKSGCESRLIVAPERWHAYVLYHLNENMSDYDEINKFLTKRMSPERKLRWMRLDNAAKIYPAAKRRGWNNFFRMSASLSEPVDKDVLQSALDVTVRRFPSIAVRLRRGLFWYYLEQVSHAPAIQAEKSCPLAYVPFRDLRKCAFRVMVYKNRLALEIFHGITDGTGALIFLKTLLAEYLVQKYRISVPATDGVLGRLEEPGEEELEDSFLRYAGKNRASRRESTAYHLSGTPEPDGYRTLTTLMMDTDDVVSAAHARGVSVTEYLCAVLMKAIVDLQAERVPIRSMRRPVKVLVPVNLRRIFPSRTMRNFALYVTPEVTPRLGDYTFAEICNSVHCCMGLNVNDKQMSARITTNVSSEKAAALKILPLFVKNAAMRAVFDAVGERKSCLCMSNLGDVKLPEVMKPYITRMDFVIGPQARAPHNCGVLSYRGTMYLNIIRNIRDSDLERYVFEVLRDEGMHVKVESNQR